jgi:hypothetical protein
MAEEQSTYSRACLDIDTNLWCLSPDVRDNIKAWFERISQEAYDRGKRDGSEISAEPDGEQVINHHDIQPSIHPDGRIVLHVMNKDYSKDTEHSVRSCITESVDGYRDVTGLLGGHSYSELVEWQATLRDSLDVVQQALNELASEDAAAYSGPDDLCEVANLPEEDTGIEGIIFVSTADQG